MRHPGLARVLVTAFVLALGLLPGLVPGLAPEAVQAARPNLTLVGDATYEVLPDESKVAVRVELTATNHLQNTVTKRYFFRTAFLTVLPGTSGFKLTGPAGKPKVTVSSKTDEYTNLRLDFGANLAAGKSTKLTLTFNLEDPGGAPDRPVRISQSLVSFQAWALATPETPGSSVTVRFPSGYSVTVQRGPLEGPVDDGAGHDVFTSGSLETPLTFVADLAGDRPTEYAETTTTVPLEAGPASILLRAWPDDPAWRDRIKGLVERALPVLEREIGVPWPVEGQLAVHEALVRSTGGYAGIFAPADRRIEIAYAAPDGVVLHELAHAWFNGGLVADRWAAEAFAAYYAELAAAELGIEPAVPAPPVEPAPTPLPLNAWGPSDVAGAVSEAYGYAASLELAEQIATRAGPDALREVWTNAARGIGAYQPATGRLAQPPSTPPELEPAPAGAPDWRGLLDLLEAETGKDFGDLWREQVARPEDLQLLADRAATRGFYLRSLEAAGDWRLPAAIRLAMRTWQFDDARSMLVASDAVMAERAKLDQAAAAARVTLPNKIRAAYEGEGGIDAAAAEARAELAIVESIARAQAAVPDRSAIGDRVIIDVGLIGAAPEQSLATAKQALAAGDLEGAFAAARDADAAWSSASRVGRSRIVSAALLLVALLLLVGLVRQHRGRRRPEPEVATAT